MPAPTCAIGATGGSSPSAPGRASSGTAGTRMTVNEEVRRARELRKKQGIQREDRGVAQIEELDPDDIAPMVVYLTSEYAGGVNGQFFLCFGSQVALVSQPRPVKTL